MGVCYISIHQVELEMSSAFWRVLVWKVAWEGPCSLDIENLPPGKGDSAGIV